jgi:hypothetical protein
MAENLLQAQLLIRTPGGSLLLCADATTDHVNMSLPLPAVRHAMHGGRIFASQRASTEGWSNLRRFLQAALFPLAAASRLVRKVGSLRRESPPAKWPATLAAASLLGMLHAMGEAAGLLLGAEGSLQAYSRMEGDRAQSVRSGEVAQLRP